MYLFIFFFFFFLFKKYLNFSFSLVNDNEKLTVSKYLAKIQLFNIGIIPFQQIFIYNINTFQNIRSFWFITEETILITIYIILLKFDVISNRFFKNLTKNTCWRNWSLITFYMYQTCFNVVVLQLVFSKYIESFYILYIS